MKYLNFLIFLDSRKQLFVVNTEKETLGDILVCGVTLVLLLGILFGMSNLNQMKPTEGGHDTNYNSYWFVPVPTNKCVQGEEPWSSV